MKFFKDPEFLSNLRHDLHKVGLRSMSRVDSADDRLDALESAFTARGLEYVFTQTYDVEYPEFLAKTLIPVNTQIPNYANTYTYFQVDKTGMADWITNYANDFKNSEVLLKEFTGKIAALGTAFSYTVQDLRAAQSVQFGVGQPLDQLRASAARFAMEQKIDDVAAFGSLPRGIFGLVNHPDIPAVTVSGGGGAWSTTLATVNAANNAIIIADLNKLINTPEQVTLGLSKPDTLLLPLSVKPRLTSPMDPSVFNAGSLIGGWLSQQDTIKNVFYWSKLDAAQSDGNLAAGTARAIAYKRDPRVLELIIPQPFEMFEPEREGMLFRVACHARIGGVTVRYPLACARMNVGT